MLGNKYEALIRCVTLDSKVYFGLLEFFGSPWVSFGLFGPPWVSVGLLGTPSLLTQESLWVSLGSLGLLGSPWVSLDSLKSPYSILLRSPYRSLLFKSFPDLNHFLF